MAAWLSKLHDKFSKNFRIRGDVTIATHRGQLRSPDRGGRPAQPKPGTPATCKTGRMRITVLAGGVGAARFLRGLVAAAPDAKITVIGNTADDITLFGLRVCPDLDTVMYTLGGGINAEQGWGRADETFGIGDELAAYGAGRPGSRSATVTSPPTSCAASCSREASRCPRSPALLCARWRPGVRLLPMSDDTIETHVKIKADRTDRGSRHDWDLIHFQEWWVRLHAAVPARAIIPVGADSAAPAPGVLEAIADADFVLFPPSNPVVSIGPILAVPGIRDAVAAKTVVGVSGIIGGAPVRGMADACLTAIGVETSAAAVAAHYGADLIDGWLVDEQDKAAVDDPALAGIAVRALPLYMRDVPSTAAIAQAAIDLARGTGPMTDADP